jgi:pimeloyl-ACP methyl ester carboxylesterase
MPGLRTRNKPFLPLLLTLAFSLIPAKAAAQESADVSSREWPTMPPEEPPADWGPVSINLEEIPYPYTVHYFDLNRFGQDMRMAYMDVAPTGAANGQTVVIQHGMNFYGEAYGPTIEALADAGFRVIAIDRIGYGRSSKPIVDYNLNFNAANMKALLDHLGLERVAIVGHSMGGMVVSRFAMVYPETTTHVVMVNQIGLSDQRQGRPWRDLQESYEGTLTGTTYQGILGNHMSYYPTWHPPHLEYVRRQYGWTLSPDWPRMAMIRALQSQILYNDPVVYDWQHIGTKALVIGGADDGLTRNYDELARGVSETLQNASLILYPGIGHNPQTEIPDQFHADLIRFLESDPDQPASEWE